MWLQRRVDVDLSVPACEEIRMQMLMAAGFNGILGADVCGPLANIVTYCCKMKRDEVIRDTHRQIVVSRNSKAPFSELRFLFRVSNVGMNCD